MRIVAPHRPRDRDLGLLQVCPSVPSFLRVYIRHVTESAPSCGRLQALLVLAIPCGLTPPFKDVTLPPLPLRNQSVRTSPCQCDRERDHGPVDTVSANSSSSSSPPRPSQRSPRKTKKQRGQGQLMAYVLILRFPPGVRKSDHARRRLRLRATGPVLAARAGRRRRPGLVGRGRSRRLKM